MEHTDNSAPTRKLLFDASLPFINEFQNNPSFKLGFCAYRCADFRAFLFLSSFGVFAPISIKVDKTSVFLCYEPRSLLNQSLCVFRTVWRWLFLYTLLILRSNDSFCVVYNYKNECNTHRGRWFYEFQKQSFFSFFAAVWLITTIEPRRSIHANNCQSMFIFIDICNSIDIGTCPCLFLWISGKENIG